MLTVFPRVTQHCHGHESWVTRRRANPTFMWRALLCSIGALALIVIASPLPPLTGFAFAQSCSADSQCDPAGRPRAECLGDVLVLKRRFCAAGQCQERIERQENCRGGETTRCTGNGFFERSAGRCGASLGVCERRAERDYCRPSCSCRGKRLTVASGQCSDAIGCQRAVVVCPAGCTCSPEPKCL